MDFSQLKQVLSHLPPNRLVESNWHQHSNGNGWVENSAQVDNSARVFGSACVYENAQVFGSAQVSENARVFGSAWVYGNACVYENAQVYGNARVFEDAQVYGNAWVFENTWVYGSAQVSENARVSGSACVCGNAQVCGNACVYGSARVYGSAQVYGDARIKFFKLSTDIGLSKKQHIACELNQYPDINGNYKLYKRVNKTQDPKIFTSVYNKDFRYELNKWAVAKNPDPDSRVCIAGGLHVSTIDYNFNGDTLLECWVNIDDVLAIGQGKLRVSKLFPTQVVEEEIA